MKKHISIQLYILLGLGLLGCQNEIIDTSFDFNVKSVRTDGVLSNQFSVSDTIGFSFSGTPDVITFYSGMVGQRYAFKGREEAEGKPVITFTTRMSGSANASSLAMLVSNDFKGIVDQVKWEVITRDTTATARNIAEAKWTDISDRVNWSNGNDKESLSGAVDLSDIAKEQKNVYLAFRYQAPALVSQPKWVISNLQLNNNLEDGTQYIIANLNGPAAPFNNYGQASFGPGWVTAIDPKITENLSVAWMYNSVTSGSNVQRLEISGVANADKAKKVEAWAIIGPLNLRKVTPDRGVAIKNIINQLPGYILPKANSYKKEGNYQAVFEARSESVEQVNQQVSVVDLIIVP